MNPTVSSMSVAEALGRLAQSRDPEAWGALVEACGPAMLRVCARILHDREGAEDACQEALLQVRACAGQFRPGGANPEAAARGWVLKVTAHVALHLLRKQRRDRARDRRQAGTGTAQSESEARAMNEEALEHLRRELAGLSEAERTPIVLHYYGGMGYEDVAAALNCPVGTAKARVSRGIERLRERLALLGLVFASGDVASALDLPAAGFSACTSEHLGAWKALLESSRQPAVPAMAAHGGISTMIKIGLGMAACVLACALMWSAGRGHSSEDAAPESGATATPEASPAEKGAAAAATPADMDEAVRKIARANNAFAVKLYGELATQRGNLFFSPFSVSTAMTQAMAGAREDTALEMAATLRMPVGQGLEHLRPHVVQDKLHPAYGKLLQALEGKGRTRAYELLLANSLWVQDDLALQPEFVATLKANYGSALQLANFKKDPEAARKRINGWIADKTAQKVRETLAPGSISQDTLLAIANTIYFKSDWKHRFEKARDRDFTLLDGAKVKTPMMPLVDVQLPYAHCVVKGRHMADQGFDALELPYKNGELSMLVLLPFGDEPVAVQLASLERELVFGNLD
ncbi:MAG: sigma-70 family RNA polymerase sigma factor, partial [Planctomycetota bacterium]|nr:sigma-70 family RNA polymerase sigma factor [Planctomycetota bacterium]